MRLMGKRQIGELEPFELVITLIIADLATIPMAEQTIPIWYGIVPLLVICVIHFVATALTKKSQTVRNILSGKPVVVVDENGVVFAELKKLNISAEELMEALRNLDYFDLTEIQYAIIERNGKITVIPKAASMPATREDIKVAPEENEMFYCIIENGKVLKKNFTELGTEYGAVMPDILRGGKCSLPDILLCLLSAEGSVYLQTKTSAAQDFKINPIGEAV
jgi:uncharacterized membrane protein YcaP (DUF421 family)